MNVDRAELRRLLIERDGQDFDGEVHLTSEEARLLHDRIEALEGALAEAEELIELSEHPAFPDPAYHQEVKALGLRIGFGALMSTASAGWREVLEEMGMPNGSEFVAGPCFGSVVRTLGIIRRARAALEGERT